MTTNKTTQWKTPPRQQLEQQLRQQQKITIGTQKKNVRNATSLFSILRWFFFLSFLCLRWFFRNGSLLFSLYSFPSSFFSIAISFLFLSSMLYITSFFFPSQKKCPQLPFFLPPSPLLIFLLPASLIKNTCYIIPNEHAQSSLSSSS